MLLKLTPKRRTRLLVPLAALLLTSCGAGADRPPEFRLQPVAYPAIPEPGAEGYTDAQVASVLAAYDAAVTEANRRLCWLRSFSRYSPCAVE